MQWDPRNGWRVGGSQHFRSIGGFVDDLRLFPNATLSAFNSSSDFEQVTRVGGPVTALRSLLSSPFDASDSPLSGCERQRPAVQPPTCPWRAYGGPYVPGRSRKLPPWGRSCRELQARLLRRLFFNPPAPARVATCTATAAPAWVTAALDIAHGKRWPPMPTCPARGRGSGVLSAGGVATVEFFAMDAINARVAQGWRGVMEHAVNISRASQSRASLCTAARMHRAAAAAGVADAHYHLAVAYSVGLAVPRNRTMAIAHLLRGAQQDVTLAQMALGFRHRHGLGVSADPDAAFAYYEHASQRAVHDQANVAAAAEHLAETVYLDNAAALRNNVGQNADMLEYLDYAAANGDVHAQADLAHLHYWGTQGVARDLPRAMDLLQRAAHAGNAAAQFSLGVMYRNGQGGLPKDNETSFSLFQEAAAQDHPGALNALGVHYLRDGGNATLALEYMKRASAQGSTDATFNLANMYRGHMPMVGKTYAAF